MRTRFLTDFFNSSAASQSLQTLDFLQFPPPQLPFPDLFKFDNLSCFDQVNSLNISPEIDSFSVNEALSKFFSDVLPQNINTEIDQQIAREVASEEKINEDGTTNTDFTLLQFETPKLCISLEDSCFLHEEKMQIFFQVTDAEVSLDLLDFSLEVQQLTDIHKLTFNVEDICLEIHEEHKSNLFEDNSLIKGQMSSDLRTFPLLEVDETSLGINSYISEDKHIIFENEPRQWMQKDESTYDANELLISMKFDILEHLLNHPFLESHKFEVPCVVNFAPEDIINAIDHPLSPLAFDQPQFFDIKTSHFSQVFSNTEIISEVERCEQMFGDTTLNTFNDLIVKHELILRDDSFKSLPVPIISDHEKILSVQTFVDDIFPKLKLQPPSTSDDIYLDWHILQEDIRKMFEDIDTYCIKSDMNLCGNQMVILEFVLSDSCSNEQNMKEKNEVLKIEISGNLRDSVCHDGIASSKALVENKVNRGNQFVESMTQFDDLDFFLNPLEANYVKKQKSADKKLEMDCALIVGPANGPIETHDTSPKQSENEFHSRGDFHSTSVLNESSKNSKEPLHSTHVKEKNIVKPLETTYEIPKSPLAMESKKVNTNTPSLPDAIIIMNTQNVETEMVISRRTTYQKILAMEKKGVQVVERDLNLPVDIIISAAVCLLFYDSKNIIKKTNSSDNASSLPSCVENIAANILTSLSFAFSSCILIFEGEVGFLGGIMESSDEIYAAAASLGINLQLFCSYSSEITDEIILKCITHAAKPTKGLYPKMPESETLAESFLSKFPSLNPLSAHAILSSVETLVDFLEMSHQQRVCAVQKFLVPQASIILFSALCRYGEREDSRSGMTDCSSSVSSGHDSEQKKRKYIGSPDTKTVPMDYLFQFEKINDVTWDPLKSVNSLSFWNLEGEELSDDIKKSIYISKNQRSDSHMMMDRASLTEMSSGQSKKVHMPINNNFKGEVIEIDDDVADEDFSFPHPKKISSHWCSLPSFPTSAEINSELDSWIPIKDNEQNSSEEFILNSNITPFKEKDQYYGKTPLSKAILSDQPQKGSPWTIDFLNRVKEKSRIRHQSLPNVSSAPCFGYSGNSSKFRKRKSPSILDFYGYQNSGAAQIMERKGQKVHLQAPNSSKAVKTVPSLSQTRAPVDKRAKRKLTFATNGRKGQSKLIWSDRTDQTLKGRP